MGLTRIISGGQTGVDQAALCAARLSGLTTGGFAPEGWLTEGGAAPWLVEFGLEEHPGGYRARIEANIRRADATLVVQTDPVGPGTRTTIRLAQLLCKPHKLIRPGETTPRQVAEWIRAGGFAVVNIAGSRESRAPGIKGRTEAFLGRVFAILRLPQ